MSNDHLLRWAIQDTTESAGGTRRRCAGPFTLFWTGLIIGLSAGASITTLLQ